MKGPDLKNLQMFRALCGTEGLDAVALVTTKWNIMQHELDRAERQEAELRSKHFKHMLGMGAMYARDNGTTESARQIVRDVLARKQEFHLPIQREVIDEGKTLQDTEPGRIVMEDILREREKNQAELKETKESMRKEHDAQMQQALKERAEDIERVLAKSEDDRRTLREEQREQMRRMEKEAADRLKRMKDQNEEILRKLKEKYDEESQRQQRLIEEQNAKIEEIQRKAQEGDTSLLWNVVSLVSFIESFLFF